MSTANQIKNTKILPKDYVQYHVVDLKNDKKTALAIQGIFLIIAGLMVFIAIHFQLPIKNDVPVFFKVIITLSFIFVYMIVHELTHGAMIRILSKSKPVYGIRIPYLYTGSLHYYTKFSFIIILLAPVVIWGLIIMFSLFFIPDSLFMSLYIVLALNFAGSSGDYVQAYQIKHLLKDVLIQDDGKNTSYYVKKTFIEF